MTPELRALASRSLGGVHEDMLAWTCLREHPRSATVWRVEGAGAAVVLKQHRHPRPFQQELRAYRDWLPRLRAAGPGPSRGLDMSLGTFDDDPRGPAPEADPRTGAPAPREADPRTSAPASPEADAPLSAPAPPGVDAPLSAPAPAAPGVDAPFGAPALLAYDPSARALALTFAPGARMSLGTADADAVRLAHAAAGRFARALHALPVADDDPLPLRDAVSARLAGWHARAGGLLAPAERAGLERLARRRDAFADARRVPCHRDFTPDNWLLEGTCLHVLDFEHARLDAPEVDLVKLRAEVWPACPALEAAFLAGHGPLTADAAARLDVLLALHAVATLAWAERHQDPAFRALGRQALQVALASA